MISTLKIEENESNERLDAYLADTFEDFSRSKIQKFIENGQILVNDQKVKSSYKIRENDCISCDLEGAEIVFDAKVTDAKVA